MGSMLGPNLSCFWCRGRLSLPEGLWSTWAPPDTDSDSPWAQRGNRTPGPHSNSSQVSSWAPGPEVWDWEWEEEGPSRGWSPSWLTGALLWLACGVGLAGNLYALGLGCCRRDRGSRLRLHLRSLAASDLLYLCTAPFAGYGAWSRDWAFGETGCRLLLGLDICTMHASAFTLVLMSAQRYRAISRPLRGPLSSSSSSGSSSTAAALLAAWMAALALSLPMATAVRVEEGDGEGGGRLCAPGWSEQESRGYLTLLFITSTLVPGLLIAGLYAGLARAYCRARRRWRRQAWLARGAGRRPLLLTLAVVLSHWLCFLPFWLWQLAPLYLEGAALPFPAQGLVNDLLSGLTYANSCLDPFLYTLLTRQHRRAERPRAEGGGGGIRLCQERAGGDRGGGGRGDSGRGEGGEQGDHAGGGNSDSKPTDGPNITEVLNHTNSAKGIPSGRLFSQN